jgi:hypothetical protein
MKRRAHHHMERRGVQWTAVQSGTDVVPQPPRLGLDDISIARERSLSRLMGRQSLTTRERPSNQVTIATDSGGRQRTLTDGQSQLGQTALLTVPASTWLRDEEAVPVACPISRSTPGTRGHSRTARYTGSPAYRQADPLRKQTF